VPASGDSEDDCGEQMECRLAGETEVLGENLPQRHFRTKFPFRLTEEYLFKPSVIEKEGLEKTVSQPGYYY
jgi:hypothetical protein